MQVFPGSGSVRVCLILCAALQAGCAVTGQARQDAGLTAPPQRDMTQEQRLQALEAGLQRLAQRVDHLQGSAGDGNATSSVALSPPEYQPVRPEVVLAERPVTPAHVPTAPARAVAPVQMQMPVPQPPAHQPQRQGDWVINLASYTNRNFASGKLAEFIRTGVEAEQVEATVGGNTIYRLRVPGFDSFNAASAAAGTIREKLGLEETWVTRR
jgi:SPOR domain